MKRYIWYTVKLKRRLQNNKYGLVSSFSVMQHAFIEHLLCASFCSKLGMLRGQDTSFFTQSFLDKLRACTHTHTHTHTHTYSISGLPRWLSGKESAFNVGDIASIPGSGRSPGEGNGNLLYPCLGNPMDRGVWRAIGLEVTKSWTQRSNWAPTYCVR